MTLNEPPFLSSCRISDKVTNIPLIKKNDSTNTEAFTMS